METYKIIDPSNEAKLNEMLKVRERISGSAFDLVIAKTAISALSDKDDLLNVVLTIDSISYARPTIIEGSVTRDGEINPQPARIDAEGVDPDDKNSLTLTTIDEI